MIVTALALLQAVAASPPDISLHATVDARSAKVRSSGKATISAHAEPDGGSVATSSGSALGGSGSSKHFELQIDARIADAIEKAGQETPQPPPR